MGGYRFRLYAKDGDDLGIREFSEPNWKVGDTVALRDRIALHASEQSGGLEVPSSNLGAPIEAPYSRGFFLSEADRDPRLWVELLIPARKLVDPDRGWNLRAGLRSSEVKRAARADAG